MSRSRSLVGLATIVLAVATAMNACGGAHKASLPPKAVPVQLVPRTIDAGGAGGSYSVDEYASARQQFALAGPTSVVADGRLFQIRLGSTLVATLQLSTVKPNIDVRSSKERAKLADLLTQGGYSSIRVNGIDVDSVLDAQKTTYIWFGQQLFELLQVKGNTVNPESLLRKILAFQKPSGQLALPTAPST